jgi:putative mRNA 3-end processing factor
VVASGDYKNVPDPTCAPFELVPCDVFITEATFGLPVFRHPAPEHEIAKLLRSVALFPERAHLVGAYGLGKAQRIIALLRAAGYREPIYLHGAMETITRYYESRGVDLGALELVRGADKAKLGGKIVICPPSSLGDLWSRRFPDPVAAFASGWMRVRARARQHGVTLPLVVSDHADWDGLTETIAATGAEEIWVTHGQEDALVHWCTQKGLRARPLDIVGYGDEEEHGAADEDAADAQRVPLPPRALASGGEGSGVGGSSESSRKLKVRGKAAPATPDPSPPFASQMGGGEKKPRASASPSSGRGDEESGEE